LKEQIQRELLSANDEIEALKVQIQAQSEKYELEKRQIEEKLIFERDKELLQKDKQYTEQIQHLRDEYNSKVKTLLEQIQTLSQTTK
jgi:hypothetical protein